jgi:outer membrane translocation and assembly module TamA
VVQDKATVGAATPLAWIAAVVSPLGPLGIDIAYGFDKKDVFGRPAPGWQLHFKLGNVF